MSGLGMLALTLVLGLVSAGGSPCGAAAEPVISPELGPALGAAVGESAEVLPSYPPCVEVTLEAEVSGKPPLELVWTLPDGGTLAGNPVVLDTGRLPDGFSEVVLTVSNDAGVATHPVAVVVEALGFSSEPSFVAVDGTTVQAEANTTGATQWRWSWGDGTATPWLSGCEGYAPSHTYPAEGSYVVTVEARSCRRGPLVATGTVVVGGTGGPAIERFRVRCPTAPFCSFEVGDVVSFDVEVSGPVEAYLYDWDGDGLDDEVASSVVESHVFTAAGYFTPRLTVLAGAELDVRHHEAPIEVLPGAEVLFSDGFESGDLRHWRVP